MSPQHSAGPRRSISEQTFPGKGQNDRGACAMNFNKRQSAAIGIFLVGLGLVMWLNLWGLLWPGALAAGGVVAYRERRRIGRTAEAVQVALWCIGLALLLLLHFIWPGVLFLAGASLLIRGREVQVDESIQRMVA